MRKLSLILLGTLSVLAFVAFSAGAADACDGKTSTAKAAKAETAEAKVAGAGGCSASKTAAVDAKVAGAGCSKSASTAMKVAGAGCASKSAGTASVAIETVRMPSGALAVFYNGRSEAAVASLHEKFEAKGASFGCDMASNMAENGDCSVEAAATEQGIMLLVTSEKAEVLDEYQSAYQVASAAHEEANDGE